MTESGTEEKSAGGDLAVRDSLAQLSPLQNPFALSDDDSSIYFSKSLKQSFEQLLHLARYGAGLLVVEGGPGSGKTSLCRAFLAHLDEDFCVARIDVSMMMNAEQLLRQAVRELALSDEVGEDVERCSEKIAEFARALTEESKEALIVLDNAHELGEDALAALFNLALNSEAEAAPHILLFGEASLLGSLTKVASDTVVNEHVSVFELAPLEQEDIKPYIEHCLLQNGYEGSFPFRSKTVEKIFFNSHGLPAAVNKSAWEEVKLTDKGQPSLNFGLPLTHLAGIAFLLITLLTLYYFNSGDEEVGADSYLSEESLEAESLTEPEVSGSGMSVSPEPVASEQNVDEPGVPESPLATEREAEENSAGQEPSSLAVLADEALDAQAAQVQPEPPAAPVVETELDKQHRMLLAMPESDYVLQLFGSYSEDSARSFVEANDIGDRFFYYRSELRERPWFVVIYTRFPDRQAAASAIDNLPVTLRDLQPWMRPMAGIQRDIRQANSLP